MQFRTYLMIKFKNQIKKIEEEMDFDKLLKSQFSRNVIVSIFVGGFLGIAGAFGTSDEPLINRLSLFIIASFIGSFFAFLTSHILDKFINDDDRPILYHILFLILMAIPTTFFIMLLGSFFFHFDISLQRYLWFMPTVILISGFFTILHSLIERVPLQTHVVETSNEIPKLINRLPIKYRHATIYAIKSEDHYLRIYTSIGDELILYRFGDALKDLEGIEGVQTHRSWWVALDAINENQKDYGKNFYLLKNQIKVPISRSFTKGLKALNLI